MDSVGAPWQTVHIVLTAIQTNTQKRRSSWSGICALMNQDVTLAQLADIVHIHPTFGEIIQDIAINS